MTLAWKTTPDGDRVWSNVPKGQLIISQGIRGAWYIDLALLPHEMKDHAYAHFRKWNRFVSLEEAKRALTDFYNEQIKADQCTNSP